MTQASKIQNVIHDVKKLKKDGSIPSSCVESIIRLLKSGELIIMPIDSVYGIIGINRNDIIDEIVNISGQSYDSLEIIISNFKMLEEMALVDKFIYNFLEKGMAGRSYCTIKK